MGQVPPSSTCLVFGKELEHLKGGDIPSSHGAQIYLLEPRPTTYHLGHFWKIDATHQPGLSRTEIGSCKAGGGV